MHLYVRVCTVRACARMGSDAVVALVHKGAALQFERLMGIYSSTYCQSSRRCRRATRDRSKLCQGHTVVRATRLRPCGRGIAHGRRPIISGCAGRIDRWLLSPAGDGESSVAHGVVRLSR